MKLGTHCKIASGLLVVVLVAGLAVLSARTDQPEPPEPKPTFSLVADLSRSLTMVSIRNRNTHDWVNVRLYLKFGLNPWEYRTARIRAGETLELPLIEFTKRNGERFDPLKWRPNTLTILCESPTGDGGFGQFGSR